MRLDADKLMDLLWIGSVPYDAKSVRLAGMDVLVLCAVEVQPPEVALRGISAIRCPMTDDGTMNEQQWRQAAQCARDVAGLVRQGYRVLVTCAQGRNRSALVSGIALHLLTGHPGWECVEYIRRRRPGALTNEAFAAAITNRLN